MIDMTDWQFSVGGGSPNMADAVVTAFWPLPKAQRYNIGALS